MILEIEVNDHKERYHLHFHRQEAQTDEERAEKDLPPLLWGSITTCLVHTGPCILTHVKPAYCVNGDVGTSKCSKKDQFVKALGAKQALARAIRNYGPEIRRRLWDAYWARTRRPKESSLKFRHRTGLLSKTSTEAQPSTPQAA